MTPTAPKNNPPAHFIGLTALRAPGGLLDAYFEPVPSRRSLIRTFRSERIARWRSNGEATGGGGEIYFDRAAVESWIREITGPGIPESENPGTPETLNPPTQ